MRAVEYIEDIVTNISILAYKNEQLLDAKDYELLQKEVHKLSVLRKYCTEQVPSNFDEISNKEYEEWKTS